LIWLYITSTSPECVRMLWYLEYRFLYAGYLNKAWTALMWQWYFLCNKLYLIKSMPVTRTFLGKLGTGWFVSWGKQTTKNKWIKLGKLYPQKMKERWPYTSLHSVQVLAGNKSFMADRELQGKIQRRKSHCWAR